ncbi:hypothetical protein [Flammeovirga pacifica]|nr:hypothetical protein [Flammeovirga pacifica]
MAHYSSSNNLIDSIQFAIVASAKSVTKLGAQDSIPTLAEL